VKLVMLTQQIDRSASTQGFAHDWVTTLAGKIDFLLVIANEVGDHNLPTNVKLISLGKERGASFFHKLFRLWRFTGEHLKKHSFDGVFVHQIEHYGLAVWPITRWNQVPLVQFKAHQGVPVTLRLAGYLFDHFVTSSEGGLELKTNDKSVIGQGIDTDRFAPTETRREHDLFEILTVGRISPVKDYQTLIRATEILVEQNRPIKVEVNIVGEPGTKQQEQYQDNLKEWVNRLGLQDVISLLPPVPNSRVHEFYQKADLFVNLSHTGSLDKAVLEAMACGCPVITSNWAYREILPDAIENEVMIPPEDEQTLARRIEEIYRWNREKRQEFGKRLREIVVREHGLDRFMDNLVNVFKQVQEKR